MACYVTANLTITDPSWVDDYVPAVHALVEQHGGRYLAQCTDVAVLEGGGAAPTVSVILEFPDRATAEGWYNSADYKPWMEARQAGSTGSALLIDGV